jgi:hypothetical protein
MDIAAAIFSDRIDRISGLTGFFFGVNRVAETFWGGDWASGDFDDRLKPGLQGGD